MPTDPVKGAETRESRRAALASTVIQEAQRELRGLVDAAYIRYDATADVWEVFAIVPEHADDVYDTLQEVEDRLDARLRDQGTTVIVRIRAHQGRPAHEIAPADSEAVFG
ncbi:MAG: hypothetical protein WBV82_30650 [Myxococcaceae bacterium]